MIIQIMPRSAFCFDYSATHHCGTSQIGPGAHLLLARRLVAGLVLHLLRPVARHGHRGRGPRAGGPVGAATFAAQKLGQVQGLALLLAAFLAYNSTFN